MYSIRLVTAYTAGGITGCNNARSIPCILSQHIGRNIFGVEAGTVVVNPLLYYQE